ncbi:MAG: hypothetical protein M1823_002602 [Watsoniomyces obsoletus]|nr:MAG: hypothetical protein M1823_002602 [Watsoniomyces obsoletus]
MASDLATLEGEIKEYKLQLETVQLGLQADPDNAELQNLKTELEEVISLTESAIAELKPASAPAPRRPPPAPQKPSPRSPVQEKWSRENHPAFQAGYRKPTGPQSPVEEPSRSTATTTYSVNDTVLARWVSGDGAFYPARITSITGSSTNPVYVVSFKSYATTETVAAKDLKPIANDSRKRKADGSPVTAASIPSPSTAAAGNSSVISAAAHIDPALAHQAKHEPSRATDGPAKPAKVPRKVKATRELEAGKSKWQDFTTKGKMGKGAKKDSMFRTPEGVNGRVGFTGSGQQMRKDPARSRHIYEQNGDDEQY